MPEQSHDRTSLTARLGKRVDKLSRLELGWVHDHGLSRLTELIDVVAADVLVLDIEDARLLPFTERAEFHVPDDGLERGLVQVVRDLRLIDCADRANRLRQDLQLRIPERRPESDWVDATAAGALL